MRWIALGMISAVIIVGIAGCDDSGGAVVPARTGEAGTATAVPPVSPTITAVGSPTAATSPTPGESPTVTPGPTNEATTRVRVTTDKLQYVAGESIVATVANSLAETIYGVTGQTYCTIVTVQRREGSEWQAAGACTDPSPPGFVPIEPNSELAVEISPRFPSDPALSPGDYRIEFAYSVGSQGDPFQTVRSEVFAIVE